MYKMKYIYIKYQIANTYQHLDWHHCTKKRSLIKDLFSKCEQIPRHMYTYIKRQ